MPSKYKQTLLKEFPKHQRTSENLTVAFKNTMIISYLMFMEALVESQKFFNLNTKNKSCVSECLNQLKKLTQKITAFTEEQMLELLKLKDNIIKKIEGNHDNQAILADYRKLKELVTDITKDEDCLADIEDPIYNSNIALNWGSAELEVIEIQAQIISISNNMRAVGTHIDQTNKLVDYNDIIVRLKELLDKNHLFDKTDNAIQNICQKFLPILDKIKFIISSMDCKNDIPSRLYEHIKSSPIVSIDELIHIIKHLKDKVVAPVKGKSDEIMKKLAEHQKTTESKQSSTSRGISYHKS